MGNNNNRQIAKNTIFLYFRMLLLMVISLYTSRVTLRILGVDDFGIYQSVCGVVTFLAFLNNALSSGTSRFITFEMGKEDPQLNILFSTVRIAHVVLGVAVLLVGEIVGLWFINNKLIIPPERLNAAIFAFHFSMITSFFQITQVPYNAIIIAYEKMNAYAYISIIEAIFKLVTVFLLNVFIFDKLEVYATLLCIVQVTIIILYRFYCRIKFKEIKSKFIFDKKIFLSILSFSGWSLIGSSAASFANQGVTIVTNMFFAPAVITVRSIALRIMGIVNQFTGNFRMAINPQIIKKYAAQDYEGSKHLLLDSTKFTYYLAILVVIPLFFLAEPLLKLWLVDVPDGTILFMKISLLQVPFQVLDGCLYIAFYAKGRIKENAIISPLLDFIQLPVVYVLFKLGFPPITLVWVETFACVTLGIIVKPLLVYFLVDYSFKETYSIILRCFIVTVLAIILPLCLLLKFDENTLLGFLIILFACLFSVIVFVWFVGIDRQLRQKIIEWIRNKIKRS